MAVVGGLQSRGARETQEDAFRIIPGSEVEPGDDLLMLLADGMGGHAGGEVAAALIVDAFARFCIEEASSPRPRERMQASLEAANAALRARKAESPELAEMGATLISAIKLGDRLVWLSVGDSMLYLFRDGGLRRLNADHSVHGELLELVRAGKMSRQDADAHPRRHALRSAVIGDDIPLIDANAVSLKRGDLVLMASDGLATLSDEQIARILAEGAGAEPRALCVALLNAVECADRPRQDNSTVLCYRYGPARQGRSPESLFAEMPPSASETGARGPIIAALAALCLLGLGLLVYAIGFSGPPGQPAASAPPAVARSGEAKVRVPALIDAPRDPDVITEQPAPAPIEAGPGRAEAELPGDGPEDAEAIVPPDPQPDGQEAGPVLQTIPPGGPSEPQGGVTPPQI